MEDLTVVVFVVVPSLNFVDFLVESLHASVETSQAYLAVVVVVAVVLVVVVVAVVEVVDMARFVDSVVDHFRVYG